MRELWQRNWPKESRSSRGLLVWSYPALAEGATVRHVTPRLPSLGLDLTLRLGGFPWLTSLLIFGIGALVVLCACYYMSATDPAQRFFSFLLAFVGSMVGLVLSGHLVQITFSRKLASLFSFLLIGHNADSYDLDLVLAAGETIRGHALCLPTRP